MKKPIRSLTIASLLLVAALAPAAWAQDAAAPAGKHAAHHEDVVEKHMAELKSRLQLTDQQAPQWDAYAQTARDNAQKADQAFRDRASSIGTASADDAMKSYAALAQMHADNMQKLAASFSALYAVLSDEQKKTADALFRHQAEHRHHHHHAKDAAPAAAQPAG